jgi:8-oxo-dGTP diphosphatase
MDNLSNNKPCPRCGRYNNRAVTIDAVIIKDNKVLLIKRGAEPFRDYWALPGGHIDWDETLKDAVRREVKEELGVEVTNLYQIGIYSDPKRHPKQSINVSFGAEITGEIKTGDDALEYRWYNLNQLPELAFDHKMIIRDYINRRKTQTL